MIGSLIIGTFLGMFLVWPWLTRGYYVDMSDYQPSPVYKEKRP